MKRILLTPKIHPLIKRFLDEQKTLHSLVKGVGSPLNILFPEILHENIVSFNNVFKNASVSSKIYYAHKANQSRALLRQAFANGINIDVASINELDNALSCGFHPSSIEATGPKSKEQILRLIQQQVLINVDNQYELEEIGKLMTEYKFHHKQNILLRFTGFFSSAYGITSKISRFGIPMEDADAMLKIIHTQKDKLNLLGFAFHLDTNEVKEKVLAFDNCVSIFEKASELGLSPRVINIGGGFRQVFIEDKEGWDEYVQALRKSLAGKEEPLSWHGSTFGYRQEKGVPHGTPIFHKYGDVTPGHAYLEQLLSSPLLDHEGRTVSKVLQENMINLYIEPGKALVDNTGITVTTVEFVKKTSDEDILVNLDIKRDNIVPVDQEVMIDPVVMYKGNKNSYKQGKFEVYFAGNLCLERDMIYTHKTFLKKLPQPGDLVIFINTAAYQMDLSASFALMRPFPKKVAVTQHKNTFQWFLDENYIVKEEKNGL